MPNYIFESEDGERIEQHHKFGEAPKTIIEDDKEYTRIINIPSLQSTTYGLPRS
jgi:hypothetical protein